MKKTNLFLTGALSLFLLGCAESTPKQLTEIETNENGVAKIADNTYMKKIVVDSYDVVYVFCDENGRVDKSVASTNYQSGKIRKTSTIATTETAPDLKKEESEKLSLYDPKAITYDIKKGTRVTDLHELIQTSNTELVILNDIKISDALFLHKMDGANFEDIQAYLKAQYNMDIDLIKRSPKVFELTKK